MNKLGQNLDPKSLEALKQVVQQGSFERAAQALNVSQSAISQRIKQLEHKLGQSLLVRNPQPSPTTAGKALLKYTLQLDQLQHSLLAELYPQAHNQWTRLAIGINADTLATWLPAALARWCEQQQVLLELKVDDQDQTHKMIQRGEVVGCISAMADMGPGCNTQVLGSHQYICIASPDFYRRYFPTADLAEGFAQAPFIRFNRKDNLQHQYLQQCYGLNGDDLPQHYIPAADSFIQWVRMGMGWGLVPRVQAQPYLDDGSLLSLQPEQPLDVDLYWHQWGIRSELIASLLSTIKGCLVS